MWIKSIDLFALVTIPVSIYFVLSGMINWQTVLLMWLMKCSLDLKLKR